MSRYEALYLLLILTVSRLRLAVVLRAKTVSLKMFVDVDPVVLVRRALALKG